MSWTFQQAQAAMHQAARLHDDAVQGITAAAEKAGAAERTYRVALHKRGIQLRASGIAATAWEGIAKGEDEIAHLRYLRDVADGELAAAKAASSRRRDDRRDTNLLADWSMRSEMALGAHPDPRLEWSRGRAA